ncbi:MAG: sigma-54 dependent transcriptional regulator [Agriterribacter sp.]
MHGNILVIDDEPGIRELMSRIIALEGFTVNQASTLKEGKKILSQKDIDVVLCDVKLPDGNGVDFITDAKKLYPLTEIILLTAYGNIPDGVQAIKNGAFDYITKGDDNNKIIPLLSRSIEKVALGKRIHQLEKQVGNQYSFDNIIGKSKAIIAAIELAKKVAATDTTVLLTGETGTGKEVFAQAIHHAGKRYNKPFVAINCSAFTKELLENQLFGHKAGAYTGAVKDEKGFFEEANNGTLFLDEIGEMHIELQAKLLRVIETGIFMRVGETKPVQVDVRIIAATNRDLKKEIETGHFRADLYYRLSVFQIALPSLRERVADIETLALYFVGVFAKQTNKKITTLQPAFTEALKQYPWHGNIRELKNVMERTVLLSEGDVLTMADLPYEIQHQQLQNSQSTFELAEAEKTHIQKVLNYTNGNKTETARLLNIALTTLYRKLEEYNIR